MSGPGRQSVAVVGAGVAGLTTAYLLQRRYDVTLFETDSRLGGHAHTHDVTSADGGLLAIDTGFIVCNPLTYPSLMRLFDELGVATQPAPMGLSVRCDGCGLEYAGGRRLRGLLARPRSAVSLRFLIMLGEIARFYRHAGNFLAEAGDDHVALGEFLDAHGFSGYFRSHFLIPVVSAVWSTGPVHVLDYPARYLFAFLDNHGMLSVTGSAPWRSVVGGSRRYVERAAKDLTAVLTSTPVRAVARHAQGVEVRDQADGVHCFDRVVIATHADTALRLLADPTPDERATLGAFRYSSNQTALHTDESVLPKRSGARVSWNYLLPSCRADSSDVIVSYDLTRLQHLRSTKRHLVSLNSAARIEPEKLIARMTYRHPVYTRSSVRAQTGLAALNSGLTAFAGAYHGWGFHEDGCRAGVAAAASFGVSW
jgi:uncharacterized protein